MAEAALPVLLGGAASALSNYFGAQTAANAAKQSAALQQQRFNQAVGFQQPFMQAGQNALNMYNNATGVNGAAAQQAYYNSFQNDPGAFKMTPAFKPASIMAYSRSRRRMRLKGWVYRVTRLQHSRIILRMRSHNNIRQGSRICSRARSSAPTQRTR